MNDLQQRFFHYLAQIQESCVQQCMIEHHDHTPKTEQMLYDVTYQVLTEMMELIDGYSGFSAHRHDLVDTVTGVRLKEHPFLELHDQTDALLRHD